MWLQKFWAKTLIRVVLIIKRGKSFTGNRFDLHCFCTGRSALSKSHNILAFLETQGSLSGASSVATCRASVSWGRLLRRGDRQPKIEGARTVANERPSCHRISIALVNGHQFLLTLMKSWVLIIRLTETRSPPIGVFLFNEIFSIVEQIEDLFFAYRRSRLENLARPVHYRYIDRPRGNFAARISSPNAWKYRSEIFRLIRPRFAVD
jgi:hypothetical protein